MGKNHKLSFTEEFDFIKKTMKSCKTKKQLKSTRNMFENFKNKWKDDLECFDMIHYMFRFESEFEKQKYKL